MEPLISTITCNLSCEYLTLESRYLDLTKCFERSYDIRVCEPLF